MVHKFEIKREKLVLCTYPMVRKIHLAAHLKI